MAEVPQITVRPSGAGGNPFDQFDVPVERVADPIELNPRARNLIIRTIFGEAGGDEPGRAAVASVIRNRVRAGRYGATPEEVVLKPFAFEALRRPEAIARMRGLREDDPHYQSIAQAVDQIFGGVLQDPTGGATHFYSPRGQAQLAKQDNRKLVPDWARGTPLANIGGQLFYAPDEPARGRSSSPVPASGGGAVTAALRTAAPPSISDASPLALAQANLPARQAAAVEPSPFDQFDTSNAAPAPAAKQSPPPFEGPEQADIGRGAAGFEGAIQGLTFGFGDELTGVQAVGRTVIPGVLRDFPGAALLTGGVIMAVDAFRQNPNPENKAIAERAVAEARARYETAKRQYPGTTMTGEILGGVAVPLPGGALTAAGRGVGTRIAGGALQGATAGGLTGLGQAEGDLAQRAGAGATGAVAGGVLGGGVSAAFPAVSHLAGRTISNLVAPKIRGQFDVAEAAAQAGRTPPGGRVLPSERTPDTVVADLLGEPGRALARYAANASPEARAKLQEFTMNRAREQYPRLAAFIESKIGPIGDNALEKLKVQAEAAAIVSPAYRQTMDLHWQGIGSPRLLELLKRDSVVYAAAKKAQQDVADQAVRDRRATPRLDSLEFWDAVKRNIDDKISGAMADPERKSAARSLTDLKNQIVNELDNATGSSYAHAREIASNFKGIERAMDDAKKFVTTNAITAAQQANLMRSMTPEAQDAFRRAGINALMTKLSQKTDTHDLWKGVYNSRDAQQKMRLLFNGDQGLIREFEALHHVEGIMERLRNKVMGNSTTAEQLIGHSLLGTAVGGGLSSFDPSTSTGAGALFGLARYANRASSGRVAEHIADLLMSNNPNAIDQVVKAAAGNAHIMQIVRQFAENSFAKTAGQQTARNIGD